MDTQRRSSLSQGRGSLVAGSTIQLSGPIPRCANKDFAPLAALNPYQSQWTVKAKVAKLFELRRFNSKREPNVESAVFTALLIDDQATEIEGTFWREAAEYYHEQLQEGKVYYFSNFSVRTANKKYASVENDYCLHLDVRSKIEEAENQDTTNMHSKVQLTQIADLPKFIDQKTLVTVLGVVIEVAATGKVKRKADSSELVRRDITLLDKNLRTVSLTLWHQLAEKIGSELEEMFQADPPVILVKNARVQSFNGISLTTVNRSEIDTSPDLPAAQELHDWYELIGKIEPTTPLNEGLPTNRILSGGDDVKLLKDIAVEKVPALEDKPVYSNAHCTVVYLNSDQPMYYLANKVNNRKVVAQDGQYYCEFDGQLYDSAELRYVFVIKVADFTKECWLNIFNTEAEELLGMSATALDEIRSESEEKYKAQLAKCRFKLVNVRIVSKARELPSAGEVVLRHNITAMKPMSYREETQRILKIVAAYDNQSPVNE